MQILENTRLGEKITYFEHPCGMKFYISQKPFTSSYCLLTVKYGANDYKYLDASGKLQEMPLGMAHFLEHKMFENADGSDSMEHFSAFGMDCNAYTSHTETSYLFAGAGDLENSLRELLTFVLSPYYTKETVDKEQGIIGEEIARSLDNPSAICYRNLMENLYKTSPIREEILGTKETIAQITAENLYLAHKTFYNPANMILAISGRITPEAVLEIANEVLPKEKHALDFTFLNQQEQSGVCQDIVEAKGPVAMPLFYIGIKDLNMTLDVKEREKRQIAVDMMMQNLFSFSSPVISKLYEEKKITNRYSCSYSSTRNISTLVISCEGENPKEVCQILSNYVKNIKENGLDEASFLRYKKASIADVIRSFDTTEGVVSSITDAVIDGSKPFYEYELISKMTKQDLEVLIPEIFKQENICMSVITPREV